MHDKVRVIEELMEKQGIQGDAVSWTNKLKESIKRSDMGAAEKMFQDMYEPW